MVVSGDQVYRVGEKLFIIEQGMKKSDWVWYGEYAGVAWGVYRCVMGSVQV